METWVHTFTNSERFTRCGSPNEVFDELGIDMPEYALYESDGWGIALIENGRVIDISFEADTNFEERSAEMRVSFRGTISYL